MATILTITLAPNSGAPSVTEFLANFDGTNGATSFTEASANGSSGTFVGNAQLDTSQQKFGSASLRLDGTGDYVTFPDVAGFNLADNDFTIEFWVRFNSIGFDSLMNQQDDSSSTSGFKFDAFGTTLEFNFGNVGGGTTAISGTWTRSTGQWYHVAACRESDSLRMFVDGTQVGSTQNVTGISIENPSYTLNFGYRLSSAATWHLDGWIDEARIVNGTGLYTANFTPPTGPFPAP